MRHACSTTVHNINSRVKEHVSYGGFHLSSTGQCPTACTYTTNIVCSTIAHSSMYLQYMYSTRHFFSTDFREAGFRINIFEEGEGGGEGGRKG